MTAPIAGARIANIEIDPLRPTVFKLGGVYEGCVAFATVVGHHESVNCVIEDPQSGDWEKGSYIYDASLNTLTRHSVSGSSNSGNPISVSLDAVIYEGTALAYIYARRVDVSMAGYAAGAGDAVAQSTSKSTAVTIDAPCGQITTHAAQLADATTALFTVNNSYVTATDVVLVTLASGNTAGGYNLWVDAVANGSFVVALRNISGGNLSEAAQINFALIDAVNA